MDHTQLLHALQNNIPTEIWYLVPLLIVAAVIMSPWFKGKSGEAVVNLSAKLFLDKARYHLIKNVTLPTEDGTTQIDHIIDTNCGVLMAEIRSLKESFGSARQSYLVSRNVKSLVKVSKSFHQD